ncbi:MAG: DUF835 domain-containing protein [Methanomassiliicoccales archaeon]
MSERKDLLREYLRGYEEGMKDAWEDLMRLTNKGYQSSEIRILAKSERMKLSQKVASKQEEVENLLGITLEDEAREKERVSQVRPGNAYLIDDPSPDRAFGLFNRLVEQGAEGLCVHRMEPGKIRNHFGFQGKVVWLTKTELPESQFPGEVVCVSPNSLESLTTMIVNFLGGEGQRVLLFGGLYYLVTHNDFSKVLRFVQSMKDRVTINGSIMLIPYQSDVLEERDRLNLENEIENQL